MLLGWQRSLQPGSMQTTLKVLQKVSLMAFVFRALQNGTY